MKNTDYLKKISFINNKILQEADLSLINLNTKILNEKIFNKSIIFYKNTDIEKLDNSTVFLDSFITYSIYSLNNLDFKTSRSSTLKNNLDGIFVHTKPQIFTHPKNSLFQFHQDKILFDDDTIKSLDFIKIKSEITTKSYHLFLLKPVKGGYTCFFYGLKGFFPFSQFIKSLLFLLFSQIVNSIKTAIFCTNIFSCFLVKNDTILRLPFNIIKMSYRMAKNEKSTRAEKRFKKTNRSLIDLEINIKFLFDNSRPKKKQKTNPSEVLVSLLTDSDPQI